MICLTLHACIRGRSVALACKQVRTENVGPRVVAVRELVWSEQSGQRDLCSALRRCRGKRSRLAAGVLSRCPPALPRGAALL